MYFVCSKQRDHCGWNDVSKREEKKGIQWKDDMSHICSFKFSSSHLLKNKKKSKINSNNIFFDPIYLKYYHFNM